MTHRPLPLYLAFVCAGLCSALTALLLTWPVGWEAWMGLVLRGELDPLEALSMAAVSTLFGSLMVAAAYFARQGAFGVEAEQAISIESTRTARFGAWLSIALVSPAGFAVMTWVYTGRLLSDPGGVVTPGVWAWLGVAAVCAAGAGIVGTAARWFVGRPVPQRRVLVAWGFLGGLVVAAILGDVLTSHEPPTPWAWGGFLCVWQLGLSVFFAEAVMRPEVRASGEVWRGFGDQLGSLLVALFEDVTNSTRSAGPHEPPAPLAGLRAAQTARLRRAPGDPVPPLITLLGLRAAQHESLDEVVADLTVHGEERPARALCEWILWGRGDILTVSESKYRDDYVHVLQRLLTDAEPLYVTHGAEALTSLRQTDALPDLHAALKRVRGADSAAARLRVCIATLERVARLPRASERRASRDILPAAAAEPGDETRLPRAPTRVDDD